MSRFRMNPDVAAYRKLIKDQEFKKFLPLVRQINRLEARRENATYRGYTVDVRKLSEKIAPLIDKRREAAQQLAKKHDLQKAERGAEHYRNSMLGGLAIAAKSLAFAAVAIVPIIVGSIISAVLFPELGNLGFLPGGAVGMVATFALVFAYVRLKVDKEAAVRIANSASSEKDGARKYTTEELARNGLF